MANPSEALQRVIASLDEGAGRTALRYLVAALLATSVFTVYAITQFTGLRETGAMDSAQIARNMAQGKGYQTSCLRPIDMQVPRVANATGTTTPELRQAPLHPWLLSRAFNLMRPSFAPPTAGRLYAPEARAVVPLGILLTIVTAFCVARLGSSLFDAPTGVLAAALYMLARTVLDDSISGTARPLLALLAVAAAWAATGNLRRQSERGSTAVAVALFIVAALLGGLSLLASPAMVIVVVALAWTVAHSQLRHPTSVVITFAGIALLVALPWALRNMGLTGNPIGSAHLAAIHDTFLFPADMVERTLGARMHSTLILEALRGKLIGGITGLAAEPLPTAGLGILGALFLASLFMPHASEAARRFRWTLIGSLAAAVIWTSITGGQRTAAAVLAPFAAIYGTAGLRALVEKMNIEDGLKRLVVAAVVILVALPGVTQVLIGRPASPYPPVMPAFITYACERIPKDEPIASDIPEATAWYGRRQAILLPPSTGDLAALGQAWRPIRAVLLTPATSDRPYVSDLLAGAWRSWQDVLDLEPPDDFPLRHAIAYPPGGREQLFLTEEERWINAPGDTPDAQ